MGMVTNEQNVFYKGHYLSDLKFELLEAPEGMTIDERHRIEWKPTASQSNQSYTVRVKAYDGTVEKIVTFEVTVAENKYLHTEIQGKKLVVVDPNSNLNGLTIEPLDGSDINSIKIKIVNENSVPDFSILLRNRKAVKISDIFLVEPRPKKFNIGMLDVEGLYTKAGTRKIGWAHYYCGGYSMHSEGCDSRWDILGFHDGENRPTGWALNDDAYYFLVKKRNILQKGIKQIKSTSVSKQSPNTTCNPLTRTGEFDDYFEFHCPLSTGVDLVIIDKLNTDENYKLWGTTSPDTFLSWIKEAQDNVNALGMVNVLNKPIKVFMEDRTTQNDGGASLYNREDFYDGTVYNYIGLDNKTTIYNTVRKGLAAHEYFHLVQSAALGITQGHTLKANWKTEGTAKWFEDYGSFDSNNSYTRYSHLNPLERVLSDGLTDFKMRYKTFAFWKILMNHCNDSIVTKMFETPIAYQGGMETLKNSLDAGNCDFGVKFDAISATESSLESAMYAYQFATVQENDISLLDANENKSNFGFDSALKLDKSQWIDDTIDIKRGLFLGKVEPYGAVSFRVNYDLLNAVNAKPIFWKLKADKDLLVVFTHLDQKNKGT